MDNRKYSVWDLVLAVFATAILFTTANEQSLWLDEATTIDLASPFLLFKNFGPFSDAQMPLAFWMPWISKMLFGDTEIALRLPFLCMGVSFICMIPQALRNQKVPTLSAYLAAVALVLFPTYIYFAQEVRAYMPMIFFMFLWGWLREKNSRLAPWACFLALFSNTFSVVYVSFALALDWVLAKKKPGREIYSVLAIIPFLLLAVWITQKTFLSSGTSHLSFTSLMHDVFGFGFVGYFARSIRYFFGPSYLGYLFFFVALANTLYQTFVEKKLHARWQLGLWLGVCFHAKIIQALGWNCFERYLIMMVPLIFLGVFSLPFKKAYSIGLALTFFVLLHMGGSFDFQSRPLPGAVSSLFARANLALTHLPREDWKGLVKFLETYGDSLQTYGFKDCEHCSHYTLEYYLRWSPLKDLLEFKGGVLNCQNDWILSQKKQPWPSADCRKKLFFESAGLFLYGSENRVPTQALKGW